MSTEKISWQAVPLVWLDGGRDLTDEERVVALREYRQTGGIAGVMLAALTGEETIGGAS